MIIGLTDRPILRRDGKIRSGYKEDGSNKLVNTDYFLLHDAPALEQAIGKDPKEIYFTVHSDNPTEFMKADLRWYNSSQLMCMSMHKAPDESGQDMGSVAAFFGVGNDVVGLQQRQFPRMQKARVRVCNYKSCPDYVKGSCTEHMFLDILVPQCSMGAIFTLDNTSINAIMNAHSTFSKAWTRYGGKISGQIFRMRKGPGTISYQKKDGSTGSREAAMVYIDQVNFEDYERDFKKHIRPEDWEALMSIRNRQFAPMGVSSSASLPPPEEDNIPQVGPNPAAAQLASPANPGIAGEDDLKKRANHPQIIPLFEELGKLLNRTPTEDLRIATMKNLPSVEEGIKYLKNKIKEAKKAQPATTAPASAPPANTSTGDAPSGGLY